MKTENEQLYLTKKEQLANALFQLLDFMETCDMEEGLDEDAMDTLNSLMDAGYVALDEDGEDVVNEDE